MSQKSLIVVRTHFVDERLITFVRQVRSHNYDVIIAVDESRGIVDMQDLPKLSLTRDKFDALGLYTTIHDIFWRCGDYALYLARRQYPNAPNYWLIEYDVAINRPDPITFFQEFDAACDHDFLTSHYRVREAGWFFGDPMQDQYPEVWRSYFPLVRLSPRALDYLLERRVQASTKINQLPQDRRPTWANDESFVACELHYNGFKCADFNSFGNYYDKTTFTNLVLFHPSHLPPFDGMIYHMVRTGSHYLKVMSPSLNRGKRPTPQELIDLTATDWTFEEVCLPLKRKIAFLIERLADVPEKVFAADGVITPLLQGRVEAGLLKAIVLALAQLRLRSCIDALEATAQANGWPIIPEFSNIALARPAWQSSFGQYSHAKNFRLDAEGANNGDLSGDYGFHTDNEANAFWTVDLQQGFMISEVRIYNRRAHAHRLNQFRLLVSLDGKTWHLAYESPVDVKFERNIDKPVVVPLQTPAQFLRVVSQQDGFLHFRELQAYGKPIAGWNR